MSDCTDRLCIAVGFQLGRDNEHVTLCNTRQANEDQTSCHYGNIAPCFALSEFIIIIIIVYYAKWQHTVDLLTSTN